MVVRRFGAFDNEAFTVVSSPSGGLVPGSAIINNSNTPIGTVFTYTDGFPVQEIVLDDLDSGPNQDLFNDDDEDDHIIIDGAGLVADGTEVESESYHFVRQLDTNGQPFGPVIQLTVFSQMGQTSNIWGMATSEFLVDGAQYIKVDGSNNGTSEYDDFIPCFTMGTRIATAYGERLVENLRLGDKVITRDNGMQEVRWIGACTVDSARLRDDPSKRPVLVRAGSLGGGMPERDTYYSPNHRILLNQPEIALLHGESEVFAAAKDMIIRPGFSRAKLASVTYVHVMFDQHEAILSNGMWSESFLPGGVAMDGLGRQQQREIYSLFPALKDAAGKAAYLPARQIAKPIEIAANAS